jgi:hypothetical protein
VNAIDNNNNDDDDLPVWFADNDERGIWEHAAYLLSLLAVAVLSIATTLGIAMWVKGAWGDALVRAFWAAVAHFV